MRVEAMWEDVVGYKWHDANDFFRRAAACYKQGPTEYTKVYGSQVRMVFKYLTTINRCYERT